MKKSTYTIPVFFVLCTVYLFGSAHAGTYLYDHFFQSEHVSANETMIAGIKMSNEKTDETKLQEEIRVWKESHLLKVTYLGMEERIPSEVFQFDIDATIENASEGGESPLLLQVDEGLFRELLTSLGIDVDRIHIESLIDAVTKSASMLQEEEREFALEDYLNSPEEMQVLAENEIGDVELTPGLEEFLSSFTEFDIEPISTFSLLEFVEDQHISYLTDEELSLISTGLYKLLLHSDLDIVQRNQGRSLPEYAELGFEARVDRELHQDFRFANPNSQPYKLRFQMTGDILSFVLEGPQLPYEVEISLENKQTIEPRVIKQYTPYVEQGRTKVRAEGKEGVQIEVWKTMLDSTGAVLKEELVSRDYYPPVHREELVSLQDYIASNAESGSEGEAADSSPASNDGEAVESNQTVNDEGDSDAGDDADQTEPQQEESADTRPSSSGDTPDPNMK
ncbi:VanW family protein [Rossellomorea sp. NS-SX7]|uniref:VanW family protein n=1 Tax=Rossellomorea sp. NS-SX7 TaxID=3463856 RepID=UPI004058E72B